MSKAVNTSHAHMPASHARREAQQINIKRSFRMKNITSRSVSRQLETLEIRWGCDVESVCDVAVHVGHTGRRSPDVPEASNTKITCIFQQQHKWPIETKWEGRKQIQKQEWHEI
jgi:hypothetical protein